jgi:hypothetical protein
MEEVCSCLKECLLGCKGDGCLECVGCIGVPDEIERVAGELAKVLEPFEGMDEEEARGAAVAMIIAGFAAACASVFGRKGQGTYIM